MGKTVAAIVGTVAVIALAMAAPYIVGPAVLGLTGITASVAAAFIVAAGSVAIGLAFRSISAGAPSSPIGPPRVFRNE